jgi:chromosomal replication initiation ATPase DnaA
MAGKATQLALDLRHRAAMARDDFLVSPSNADAVGWIDRWPDWPGHVLVIVGPPACGKTHLGHVWRQQAGAVLYDPANFVRSENAGMPVFVDDLDDAARDEELFHLFNAAGAAGGYLLFASRTAPARWENRLADLKSRLGAAPTIQIHPPDEPLIAAVMLKMFADEQIDVGAEVLDYLVKRMERSFDAARTLVAALNNASLASKRGITIPLARAVLDDLNDGGDQDI